MDYSCDINYKDTFNYEKFFTSGNLSDCELHIHQSKEEQSYTVIKAHKVILANSSLFFLNVFTAGMEETQTGIAEIYQNPYNLIPRVIDWMYTGKIDFTIKELMPLFNIAHVFEISQLESQMNQILEQKINKSTILNLVKECYDNELPQELQTLIPHLASLFNDLQISDLSELLDVCTFAKVIKLTKLSTEDKVLKINEFLQDWKPSEEEKDALLDAFGPDERHQLNTLIPKHNVTWIT